MRKSIIAGLVLTITLLAGAGMLYSDTDKPDGLPEIGGNWTGKARVKAWDMTGEGDHYRGREPLEVKVGQEGFSVFFTIFTEDGGEPLSMKGVIGDGRFWAYGESESGPLLMVGKVRNKGRKIIASFLGGEGPSALEVKLQLKKDKEIEMRR